LNAGIRSLPLPVPYLSRVNQLTLLQFCKLGRYRRPLPRNSDPSPSDLYVSIVKIDIPEAGTANYLSGFYGYGCEGPRRAFALIVERCF
jgi:hypothetical protein